MDEHKLWGSFFFVKPFNSQYVGHTNYWKLWYNSFCLSLERCLMSGDSDATNIWFQPKQLPHTNPQQCRSYKEDNLPLVLMSAVIPHTKMSKQSKTETLLQSLSVFFQYRLAHISNLLCDESSLCHNLTLCGGSSSATRRRFANPPSVWGLSFLALSSLTAMEKKQTCSLRNIVSVRMRSCESRLTGTRTLPHRISASRCKTTRSACSNYHNTGKRCSSSVCVGH